MIARVYLAGPDVFRRNPKLVGKELKRICTSFDLEGVFPSDAETSDEEEGSEAMGLRISEMNEQMIRDCDAVLANLNPFRGPSADAGTVFELGLARGLGKLIVGYTCSELTFTDRTLQWMDGLGEEPKRHSAGRLEDSDGMQIESFGLSDNLMIEGGIRASGGRIVGPRQSAARGKELFEVAAELVAELLGKRAADRD